MIRADDRLAIAVRKPDGAIEVQNRPWFSLTSSPVLKKPFMRGFPILLETLVNGISALNFSAQKALEEENQELKPWAMTLTLAGSIAFALFLFVVVPHLFTLGVKALGLSGGVEDLSFHAWDGLFKMAVFIGYIGAISLLPDIRRVFQYHGAEHKVIWAHEKGQPLTPEGAKPFSRLHPRCGTAFVLFVLAVSIALYAVLVPALLSVFSPESTILKHAYIVGLKLVLMIPISAVAYEIVKYAGKHHEKPLCRVLSGPGLFMQLLTTHEPDEKQLEVAIAALKGATQKAQEG
ncbi:DUF1385 domain-containing protein [Desulfolutivibrio sulfoxidireducens]|nr:DUF1385 domain-containing protein [Desulfolutivibrio sulfoxidireducens]QLA21663.1 DUF1385 domain-containing protein [Desulfolutivibrio sulfoxidireducens]